MSSADDNLLEMLAEALRTGALDPDGIRSVTEQAISEHIGAIDSYVPTIADKDAVLTECQIWIGNDHPTYDQAEATKAVEVVIGPGRTLRLAEDGLGWLVELRGLELDALHRQGFIDLEERGYRIIGSE